MRLFFGRDKTHGGAACRLANGFGIDEVILVTLDKGTHELRRDQLGLMGEAGQLPGLAVRSGTGLHDGGARMRISEEFDQLFAAEFLAQQRFALAILSMNMKAVLELCLPRSMPMNMTFSMMASFRNENTL